MRSTGTLHLTAHHLIFILDSRGPSDTQDAFVHASRKGKQKLNDGEIWVCDASHSLSVKALTQTLADPVPFDIPLSKAASDTGGLLPSTDSYADV